MKKPFKSTLLMLTIVGAAITTGTAHAFWWPFNNGWGSDGKEYIVGSGKYFSN